MAKYEQDPAFVKRANETAAAGKAKGMLNLAKSYRTAGGQSYLHEHQTIFRPIARDYELIRRISSGAIYHVGAVG